MNPSRSLRARPPFLRSILAPPVSYAKHLRHHVCINCFTEPAIFNEPTLKVQLQIEFIHRLGFAFHGLASVGRQRTRGVIAVPCFGVDCCAVT